MHILLLLLAFVFISGCSSNGYDRHYIVSDAVEEMAPVPEED